MTKTMNKEYTEMQFRLEEWVNDWGFGTKLEELFEPYTVDIFVPNLMLAVELDGPFHWKKQIWKRDGVLINKYHLTVWHVPWEKVKDGCKEELALEFKRILGQFYGKRNKTQSYDFRDNKKGEQNNG